MDCLRKLKKFRDVLSTTSLFEGKNMEVNELIEEIMGNLNELEEFIEDDLFVVSDGDEPLIASDDDY